MHPRGTSWSATDSSPPSPRRRPTPPSRRLATAAADERVTIEALVGLVPLGDVHAVESFALVWWSGDGTSEVTAVVRGHAVVDLSSPGGTRRFDSRGIRPWHLAEFGSVVGLRITSTDAPLDRLGEAADPVPRGRASLRASTVEWTASVVPRRPDAAAADADTVLMRRHLVPVADDASDHDDDASADTVLTPPRPERRPGESITATDVGLVGRAPRPLGGRDLDGSPPPTVPVDVNAVHALSAAARAGAAAGEVDREAASRSGAASPSASPSESPSRSAPSSSTPAGDPAATAQPLDAAPGVPVFRVGGGPPHPITGRVLIGRRPLAPRIPDAAGGTPQLVTVPSPRAVVSGTHLELRLEGTRLVATDLQSTNGTIVRGPSGSRRMRAGESIVVAPGSSLDLGDDTIIEILPAPEVPPESTPTRQQAAP